jgi:predicted anti-sigma-YlaC factor YlaD
MTCDQFRDALVVLDDPGTALAAGGALAGHTAACASCRAWAGRYAEGAALWHEQNASSLTASVLAQTTGPACERARLLLASAPDDELAPDDRLLVGGHLERCADCRAFAAVWDSVAAALPSLAVLDPDAAFVDDVLARTSRRPSWRWWADDLRAAWLRVVERPRFAWEAAYVCTLCWLLVFGNPIAAFDWTTARVGAVAREAVIKSGQIPEIGAISEIRKAVPAWPGREDVVRKAERLVGDPAAVTSAAQSVWERSAAWGGAQVDRLFEALTSTWQSVVAWIAGLFTPSPEAPAASTEPPAALAR